MLINHRRESVLAGLWHDFANLFPMLDAAGQDSLRADIQAYGVREPVIIFDGRILDGRNRYMAARDLGVDFPVADFAGTEREALQYVLSTNLHRRHLTESQRAAVAAKLANMTVGNPAFANPANLPNREEAAPAQVSQADAAALLNVSERSVRTAKTVQEHGLADLSAMVDRGDVSVSAAAAVAMLPTEEQAGVVAAGPAAVKDRAKAERKAKAPDDPDRKAVARLTPEAMVDEILGLKAELAEERTRRKAVEAERDNLKGMIKAFESEDMGRALGNALREVAAATGRMGEYQAKAAKAERYARILEGERDALKKQIEAQVLPL